MNNESIGPPNPIKINSMPINQAEDINNYLLSERKIEDINFKNHQYYQQPPPPPQFLPPPPQYIFPPQYIYPPPQYLHPSQHIYDQSIKTPYKLPEFYGINNNNNNNNNNFIPEWTNPPLPEYIDPKKSIDLKLIRKPKKKDNRCYACKPRGKVKKHIINTSSSGNYTFHHDMHKRPVIIITPNHHVDNFNELTNDNVIDLFKSIDEFCKFWGIIDYQITINYGKWQQKEENNHFHCKIRLPEKLVNRFRRDHFEKLKLDKRYDS